MRQYDVKFEDGISRRNIAIASDRLSNGPLSVKPEADSQFEECGPKEQSMVRQCAKNGRASSMCRDSLRAYPEAFSMLGNVTPTL